MRSADLAKATNTINTGLQRLTDACAAREKVEVIQDRHATPAREAGARLPGKAKALNERSLNKPSKKQGSSSASDSLATVANGCSYAFQTLHNTGDGSRNPSHKVNFKLENVFVAFIGRTITLGLHDVALTELGALHQSLADPVSTIGLGHRPQPLAKLLPVDCGPGVGVEFRDLLMDYHLLVLRMAIAQPEAGTIQTLIPYLDPEHAASPTRNVRSCQSNPALAEKAAKNAQVLVRLLSTLGSAAGALRPGKANSDTSSMTRLRLQVMALQTRLICARNQPRDSKVDDAVWNNWKTCLEQYAHSSEPHPRRWVIACEAQHAFNTTFGTGSSSDDVPSSVCQILTNLALDQSVTRDALYWCRRGLDRDDQEIHSKLARLAWTCKHAALELQLVSKSGTYKDMHGPLIDALGALNGPLSGTMIEFGTAVEEATRLRKATVAFLKQQNAKTQIPSSELSQITATCHAVLSAYIRLLAKYLGSCVAPKNGAKKEETCQQRRDQVLELCKAGIESVVFSLKRQQSSKPVDLQLFCRSLEDCAGLLEDVRSGRSVDCRMLSSEIETDERLLVLISDAYWTLYASQVDGWQPKEETLLLRGACGTLQPLKDQVKRASRVPLRHYKLGKALQRLGAREEALDAFDGSIRTLIDAGLLNDSSAQTRPKKFLRDQDSTEHRVFRNALKASIDLRLDPAKAKVKTAGTTLLDDQGHIRHSAFTEMQFEVLLERALHSPTWSSEAIKLGNRLLLSYDAKTHPLRHRLTLVKLLNVASHPETHSDQARTLQRARSLVAQPIDEVLVQDSDLCLFRQDIVASLRASVGLADLVAAKDHLASALVLWEEIAFDADVSLSLFDRIIDLEGWTAQLEAIAAFFELQDHERLRLTALRLLGEARRVRCNNKAHVLVEGHVVIASHLLRSGFPQQAEQHLLRIDGSELESMDLLTRVRYQILRLDLTLGRQDFLQCAQQLAHLQACYRDIDNPTAQSDADQSATRTDSKLIMLADLLQSSALLQLESGTPFQTLLLAKRAVAILQILWKSLAKQTNAKSTPALGAEKVDEEQLADGMSRMSIAKPDTLTSNAKPHPSGPACWTLATKLFRSLMLVSRLSKHYGLYRDAIVAADQALILARASASDRLTAEALVALADASSRAEQAVIGIERFKDASDIYDKSSPCKGRALYGKSFGYHNHVQGQWAAEMYAYDHALDVLSQIAPPVFEIQSKPGARAMNNVSQVSLRKVHETASTTKNVQVSIRSKVARSRGKVAAPKVEETRIVDHCHGIASCRALQDVGNDITRSKADTLIVQGRLDEATHLLEGIKDTLGNREQQSLYETSNAMLSLRKALAKIDKDTMLRMLTESTICYPSIQTQSSSRIKSDSGKKRKQEGKAAQSATATSKGGQDNDQATQSIAEAHLLVALKDVLEQGSTSEISSSNFTVSRKMMSTTVAAMLLSMVNSSSLHCRIGSTTIGSWIETPRDISVSREQQVTQVNNLVSKSDTACALSCDLPVEAVEFEDTPADLSDLLPESWSVVSFTLSEDQKYLFVNRYLAGKCLTVLRIPISKQQVEESLEDSLTFQEAASELLDIIRASDVTIQQGRDGHVDTETKSAKSQWWAEREALDARLKDLLVNIEHMWFGGFRSILTDDVVNKKLLASFRQAFSIVLGKHLPSRHSQQKKTTNNTVEVSDEVLELFLGLGPPSDHGHDMEDSLTDLLYFVMDILQFNGEQNAYDEVDFDAMIVDTQDALQSYHGAVRADGSNQKLSHTVLILDKKLHAFPWESMACLSGRSVSRLPSLVDLRDRIHLMQRQQADEPTAPADGIHVPQANGTYILNPSCDLPKTQTRFSAPLSTLTKTASWTAIAGRAPSEPEFGAALALQPAESSSASAEVDTNVAPASQRVLLYLGHGSGSHYIRPKRIKRLHGSLARSAGCATTLLFGCSSIALTSHGEFEPTGVPKTYLLAGAPAVLGALWDVTDGDCDVFAAGVLGRWGLIDQESLSAVKSNRGSRKGGKTRGGNLKKAEQYEEYQSQRKTKVALSEAAAVSRGDCYLRYLNGAAMVVYGVPVYLDR